MKRFTAGAMLLICLAGCRDAPSGAVEAVKAPDEKEAVAPTKGTIRLDERARREAGIEVAPVETREAAEGLRATGQLLLNEDQTWHIGSVADGKVLRVSANLGDTVRRGQVLAYVHSHAVHEARAAYREAIAERERTRSALSYARSVRDRAGRLLALQAVSQEQFDLSETELRARELALEKSEAQVEKELHHLTDFLEVTLESSNAGNDDPTADAVPIKAPAAGLVMARHVGAGAVVTMGQEAFTISNTASLWLIAAVNESDLAGLRAGRAVEVRVKAYPEQVFAGRILKLGEQLDPATRTLQVRVLVPNTRGMLKPNMFAETFVSGSRMRSAVVAPESAMQELEGQTVVFVEQQPGLFVVRAVQRTGVKGGMAEIAAGLAPGDRVVVKGSFVLKSELLKSSLAEE